MSNTYLTAPLLDPALDALRELARKAALRERSAYRRFDASGKTTADMEKLETIEEGALRAWLAYHRARQAAAG